MRLAWEVVRRGLQDLYDSDLPVLRRFDAWVFLGLDELWMELLGIKIREFLSKYPFPPFVISMEEIKKWEKGFYATIPIANDTKQTVR
jgi:hypothetical protein